MYLTVAGGAGTAAGGQVVGVEVMIIQTRGDGDPHQLAQSEWRKSLQWTEPGVLKIRSEDLLRTR